MLSHEQRSETFSAQTYYRIELTRERPQTLNTSLLCTSDIFDCICSGAVVAVRKIDCCATTNRIKKDTMTRCTLLYKVEKILESFYFKVDGGPSSI